MNFNDRQRDDCSMLFTTPNMHPFQSKKVESSDESQQTSDTYPLLADLKEKTKTGANTAKATLDVTNESIFKGIPSLLQK